MLTHQYLTQIVKPENGKLTIEIPVADDHASTAYEVTIEVVPQAPSLMPQEQAKLVDRLFGSIPDLPGIQTDLKEYPFEQREW